MATSERRVAGPGGVSRVPGTEDWQAQRLCGSVLEMSSEGGSQVSRRLVERFALRVYLPVHMHRNRERT